MSEGLSDQRVALIVLGVLLILTALFCWVFPCINEWTKGRNDGKKDPWRWPWQPALYES